MTNKYHNGGIKSISCSKSRENIITTTNNNKINCQRQGSQMQREIRDQITWHAEPTHSSLSSLSSFDISSGSGHRKSPIEEDEASVFIVTPLSVPSMSRIGHLEQQHSASFYAWRAIFLVTLVAFIATDLIHSDSWVHWHSDNNVNIMRSFSGDGSLVLMADAAPSFRPWSDYFSRTKPRDLLEEEQNLKAEHNCKLNGRQKLCERCTRAFNDVNMFPLCCTNTNETFSFCEQFVTYTI